MSFLLFFFVSRYLKKSIVNYMFDLMSFFHSYLYIFYVNKYVEYIYNFRLAFMQLSKAVC